MGFFSKLRKFNSFEMILFAGLILFAIVKFEMVITALLTMTRILMPLLVGIVIAYILDLIVKIFEKYYFPKSTSKWIVESRKPVSVILSIVFVILILFVVITLITPQIVSMINALGSQIPLLYENIVAFANDTLESFPQIQQNIPKLPEDFEQQLAKVLSSMTGGALNFAGSALGSVFGMIISIVFALYLLLSKESLLQQFNRFFTVYLPSAKKEKLYSILEVANHVFSKFFVGQAIEAVILGALCTIGMMILGFPYAGMIGTVVGLTALIPMIGAFIGGAIGFILIFAENMVQAVGFVIFLVILQQFESGAIYPKVVGASVGLPGVFVFAAVIVGGGLFGITGIIFGVPIAATAYKLIQKDVRKRLETQVVEPSK